MRNRIVFRELITGYSEDAASSNCGGTKLPFSRKGVVSFLAVLSHAWKETKHNSSNNTYLRVTTIAIMKLDNGEFVSYKL